MHFFVTSFYLRNDLHLRPSRRKPMSDDPADLLSTQRINFSYAKMHATAARALTRDPTIV